MTTEQRLDRLERSAKRWKFVAVAMSLLFSLSVAWLPIARSVAADERKVDAVDVIRAKSITLVDQNGAETVKMLGSHGSIGLFDPSNPGLRTVVFPGSVLINAKASWLASTGAGFALVHEATEEKNRKHIAELGITESGGAIMTFCNPSGIEVVNIQANKKNEGMVGVNDVNGKIGTSLSVP